MDDEKHELLCEREYYNKLKAERDELKDKNEKLLVVFNEMSAMNAKFIQYRATLIEALKYYATDSNWEHTPYDHEWNWRSHMTIKNDLIMAGEGGGNELAGKHAKEALQKIGEA
jgi:hypothetical protein